MPLSMSLRTKSLPQTIALSAKQVAAVAWSYFDCDSRDGASEKEEYHGVALPRLLLRMLRHLLLYV